MATPSRSYEPATEREMYDGTMPVNAAASSPAPLPRTSCMNPYAASAAKAEKSGAVKTQASCTWMGMLRACRALYIIAAVQMRPCVDGAR
jgi:hypothetical protein